MPPSTTPGRAETGWFSQPAKTGEDGYKDAGVSRDTGDWSGDLSSQGYSVTEGPRRVLKLPIVHFKVSGWIDVIGVPCTPFDHGFELLFGAIGEMRFGGLYSGAAVKARKSLLSCHC
jgi:hypothetical protein